MGAGPELALAVCKDLPRSCPDDVHLFDALRAEGVRARCVAWDAAEDWSRFDGVLVRATWDYTERLPVFLAWVAMLERIGVLLWNPPAVVRWNADKRYLRDLAARGVPTVPTEFALRGDARSLAEVMDAHGWDTCVVKPVVSAGARGALRVARREASGAEAAWKRAVAAGDMMVQPFVREVAEQGEWSFVFLDGAFSHALVKKPAKGDFRVQEKHGGTLGRAVPTSAQVARAAGILAHAPAPEGERLLYGRVDVVDLEGTLTLMELEVLEPELFFRLAPDAAPRLARALRRHLGDA
jgi:glutathione synthase/RimK-type ligase-like ATP-grasp enzyme